MDYPVSYDVIVVGCGHAGADGSPCRAVLIDIDER